MITLTFLLLLIALVFFPLYNTIEKENNSYWKLWILFNILWIIPIFTGVNVPSGEGEYKVYITAVEKNGAIFKGYNAYVKTDLTSSNEDVFCINRDDKNLIEKLKEARDNKQNIVIKYEKVWQYKIGECPGSDEKIIGIK